MSALRALQQWTRSTRGKEYSVICKAIFSKYHRWAPEITFSQWQRRFTDINCDRTSNENTERRKKGNQTTSEAEDGNNYTNSQLPLYPGHIPTSLLQKAILFGGSAVMGLYDPWRADMIAVNGEVVGGVALAYMYSRMKGSVEGRLVLNERPRISTKTVDYEALASLPDGTLGKVVSDFNIKQNISPDSRTPVRFVDDSDLAYVMTRYREVHDLLHALLGMPTDMVGEVTVKWVEALQFGIPMCAGGAMLGPLRFKTASQIKRYSAYRPWAIKIGTKSRFILNVYYEQRWEQDIDDLRREMRIDPVPSI